MPPSVVKYEPELMSAIGRAAKSLRPPGSNGPTRLSGLVEDLNQDSQETLIGDVAITTLLDGQVRKVRFSLEKPQYDKLIEAFGGKKIVEISGDLFKEGKYWVLRQPYNLVVHDSRDEE